MNAPAVVLLDATCDGLDEGGLRRRARDLTAPGSRFVSRSYCFPYALLACGHGPVGVDIERVAPSDAAFADAIRTPAERAAARGKPLSDHELISLWSSKEALAKALGDALDYDPRRLDGPASWPGGRAGAWAAQELDAPEGHVAWLCWRAGDADDGPGTATAETGGRPLINGLSAGVTLRSGSCSPAA